MYITTCPGGSYVILDVNGISVTVTERFLAMLPVLVKLC